MSFAEFFRLRGASVVGVVLLVMVAGIVGLAVGAFGATTSEDHNGRVVIFVNAF